MPAALSSLRTRRPLWVLATLGCLLGLIASGGASPASAAPCTPAAKITSKSYSARVCGVPDFDQRRTGAYLAGDGRYLAVRGLPGGGNCHCVPTTFTDLFGYYAAKGVDIRPGSFDWENRPGHVAKSNANPSTYLKSGNYTTDEIKAYNKVGWLIDRLGSSVDYEDDCGTSIADVIDDKQWLNTLGYFPNSSFNYYFGPAHWGTPATLAKYMGALGATTGVVYGAYPGYTQAGIYASSQERNGGHMVAVEGVSGSGLNPATLLVRDPASDDSDVYRQSMPDLETVTLSPIFHSGGRGQLWTWDTSTAWMSGDPRRILDHWLAVMPTHLVTVSGKSLGWMPGIALNKKASASAGGAGPAGVGFARRGKVEAARPIRDATLMPSEGKIAYLMEGSSKVHTVSLVDKSKGVLGEAPAGARDLEGDPLGEQLYVLGSKRLVSLSSAGEVLSEQALANPMDSITYDSSPQSFDAERLIGVSAATGKATSFGVGLEPLGTEKLPDRLLAGKGRLAVAVDRTGNLLVRRGSGGRVRGIDLGSGSGKVFVDRLSGAAGDAGGVVTSDMGSLLTVVNGKLAEYGRRGLDKNSAFTGIPAEGRVVSISRSGGALGGADPATLLDQRLDHPALPEMAYDPEDPGPDPDPGPEPGPEPEPTPTGKPDLVLLHKNPAEPTQLTVRNIGNAASGPFRVRLEPDGTVRDFPGLAPGEEQTFHPGCGGDRSGTVDPDNTVDESDETNNVHTWSCHE